VPNLAVPIPGVLLEDQGGTTCHMRTSHRSAGVCGRVCVRTIPSRRCVLTWGPEVDAAPVITSEPLSIVRLGGTDSDCTRGEGWSESARVFVGVACCDQHHQSPRDCSGNRGLKRVVDATTSQAEVDDPRLLSLRADPINASCRPTPTSGTPVTQDLHAVRRCSWATPKLSPAALPATCVP
jgi:hypothetical protein